MDTALALGGGGIKGTAPIGVSDHHPDLLREVSWRGREDWLFLRSRPGGELMALRHKPADVIEKKPASSA